MTFKKGQSGNPAGKAAGTLNKKTRVSLALDAAAEDVTNAVITAAKGGDMQAARLVLERVKPPLRPKDEPAELELDEHAPLSNQARSILAAVKQGQLTPDQGKQLMDLVSQAAQVITGEEALAQLAQLRAEVAEMQKHGSGAPGGVLAAEMDHEGNLK